MRLKQLILGGSFCLLCVMGAAQNAEAIRLGGRVLQIPEYWAYRYEPAEVLIRVKVEADSSLSLVQVLDGKDELIPLLVEHLSVYKYLLQAGEATQPEQELDVILELLQAGSEPVSKVKDALLTEIEAWIRQRRLEQSPYRPLGHPETVPNLDNYLDQYRAGYRITGLAGSGKPIVVNGFQLPGSLFSDKLYQGWFSGFYHRVSDHFEQSYANLPYPYGIASSEIEAGLGDYEHRFARGSLKKNKLLGIDRLYTGFDFLVQNGRWTEINSAQTALKYHLRLPLWQTDLELEYADYATDIAMTELQPEFWQNTNFMIDQRHRQLYAAWRNPWLDLAVSQVKETAKAAQFFQTLKSEHLHLQASRQVRIAAVEIDAKYEHAFREVNHDLPGGQYKDLAQVEASYAGTALQASAQAQLYDFERLKLQSLLFWQGEKLRLGTYARAVLNEEPAQTTLADIYLQGNTLPRVDKGERHKLGAFLGWQSHKLQTLLSLGTKGIEIQSGQPVVNQSAEVFYLDLSAVVNQEYRGWELDWKPALIWQSGVEELAGEPGLCYVSHVTLRRNLPYDNAVFAGFSVQGHTDYLSLHPLAFTVEGSAIYDLWAGVQVSNRFELLVSYKNIGNADLWGVYPIPPSLHASLRWYYLN